MLRRLFRLRGVLAFLLSSFEHRCAGSSDCGGGLAFLLSSLEHRCTGSSDCGGVLEYIESMCIEAHLETHVYDLYIPTHLGLEEYNNYSLHYPSPRRSGPERIRCSGKTVAAQSPTFIPYSELVHNNSKTDHSQTYLSGSPL